MKTDINEVKIITKKMRINDLLYRELREEYDRLVAIICGVDNEDFAEEVERLYFPRRVLSLLSNQDLPLRCAVGLYAVDDVLIKIAEHRERLIGDSDSDTDIMAMLLELGYRAYDVAASVGISVDEMYHRVILQKKGEI